MSKSKELDLSDLYPKGGSKNRIHIDFVRLESDKTSNTFKRLINANVSKSPDLCEHPKSEILYTSFVNSECTQCGKKFNK